MAAIEQPSSKMEGAGGLEVLIVWLRRKLRMETGMDWKVEASCRALVKDIYCERIAWWEPRKAEHTRYFGRVESGGEARNSWYGWVCQTITSVRAFAVNFTFTTLLLPTLLVFKMVEGWSGDRTPQFIFVSVQVASGRRLLGVNSSLNL